jgi:hypothetical protein
MTEEKVNEVTPTVPEVQPKRKRKNFFVVLLLLILALVLIFTTVLTVVGFDIWRVAFDPTLVKGMLTDEFVDSPLIPRVLENLSQRRAQERIESGESLSGVNEPDIMLLISFLDFDDWNEMRRLIVTDEFITHLISVTVDSFYDWLDSSDPSPKFVWDVTALKDNLTGQAGMDAIMVAYRALPECTDQELADFEARLGAMPPGVEILYNLCQFPGDFGEDQIGDYVNALVDVSDNVPDEYDFSRMLGGEQSSGFFMAAKMLLRAFRTLGPFLWAVPLVVLILMGAIGVRSWGDAGGWLGVPLLLSGGLVLGGTYSSRAAMLSALYNRFGENISPLLREELQSSYYGLSGHVFQPMLIQGAVIAGIGLVLIVLGIVLGKKKKQGS